MGRGREHRGRTGMFCRRILSSESYAQLPLEGANQNGKEGVPLTSHGTWPGSQRKCGPLGCLTPTSSSGNGAPRLFHQFEEADAD